MKFQQSLLKETQMEYDEEEKEETNVQSQIPGIEIVLDDDEEAEKTEEIVDEVILDESDESKLTNTDEKKEEQVEYEDEDDDVIIKEETIEQIVLDDDDDKIEDEEYSSTSSPASTVVLSPKEQVEVIDDGFVDVNEGLLMLQNGGVKVKTEPIDDGKLNLNYPIANCTYANLFLNSFSRISNG